MQWEPNNANSKGLKPLKDNWRYNTCFTQLLFCIQTYSPNFPKNQWNGWTIKPKNKHSHASSPLLMICCFKVKVLLLLFFLLSFLSCLSSSNILSLVLHTWKIKNTFSSTLCGSPWSKKNFTNNINIGFLFNPVGTLASASWLFFLFLFFTYYYYPLQEIIDCILCFSSMLRPITRNSYFSSLSSIVKRMRSSNHETRIPDSDLGFTVKGIH